MPYCISCGKEVDAAAAFCRNCGAAQRLRAAAVPHDLLHSLDEQTACVLCYIPVVGIIPSVIFLAAQRFRTNYRVRFNAFQALYLFVVWLIVSWAMPSMFGGGDEGLRGLLRVGLIALSIFLLVKTSRRQDVRIPVIGELAMRSTHEQL